MTVKPLLEIAGDWRQLLSSDNDDETLVSAGRHERTGRPLGSVGFIEGLEKALDKKL